MRAPARCSVCLLPSKRVISRPSSDASSCDSLLAINIDQVLVQRLLGRVGVRRSAAPPSRHRRCGCAASHTSAERPRRRSRPSAPRCASGLPISKTTWAAPASVPGAMAATSAASSRKNPAEPARAPDGRHVHDHRNARAENGADHGAHRIHQAAGRIHLDQQSAARRRSWRASMARCSSSALTGWMVSSSTNFSTSGCCAERCALLIR